MLASARKSPVCSAVPQPGTETRSIAAPGQWFAGSSVSVAPAGAHAPSAAGTPYGSATTRETSTPSACTASAAVSSEQ